MKSKSQNTVLTNNGKQAYRTFLIFVVQLIIPSSGIRVYSNGPSTSKLLVRFRINQSAVLIALYGRSNSQISASSTSLYGYPWKKGADDLQSCRWHSGTSTPSSPKLHVHGNVRSVENEFVRGVKNVRISICRGIDEGYGLSRLDSLTHGD